MKRRAVWKVMAVGLPVTLGLLLAIACDQDWPEGMEPDTTTFDSGPDITADTNPPDTSPDVPDDTGTPDTGPPDMGPDTGPCEYPAGPYSFDRVGAQVGPATWPTCIKGSEEISTLALADFEEFYCDPSIEGILVFMATLS